MQRVEAYRVEIPIVAKDEYSSEMDKVNKTVDDNKKKVSDNAKAQEELSKSAKSVAKSQDDVTKSTRNASKGIEDVGKSAEQTEKRIGRTMRTFESFGSKVKSLQRAKANIEVTVKDNATRTLNHLRGTWDGFRRNPITRLTIFAVDRAFATLRGIKNTVLSIPTMITIGLSYVGIKNLGDATVGAAMNWEKYEVSMEHWLDGNTKKAKELTKWMGEFADITPFSSPELFPALTHAVSITDKDLNKSKRLLAIASDMAALTPGRSVEDAMQAIANSKMGNTVMLQGFGLDISKKQMDAMGGWDKLINKLEKDFKGGAEKLSKTAAGVLATLKGYRGSFMRSIGTGFLEPMKPRLDAINQWLADNQDKWGRWKSVAMGHGKALSEGIFSTLERGFGFVQSRYLENPYFMNLDLKGKIGFISGDIGAYMNGTVKPRLMEWWGATGSGVALEIGKSIGSGIVEGIKIGIQAGANVFTSSWKELFTNFEETGFSKETGKSALGALATTAGAGYLGKKLIYNPTKSVINTGRNIKGWVDNKQAAKAAHSTQQTTTRASRHIKPTTGSKLLRRTPVLGSILGALAIGTADKEDRPGVIGSLAGGLVGAKGGAVVGAAIGSVVPGVGTAIGGSVGGLIGGIGGAIGGEWLGSHWETIKGKATEATAWIGTQFSKARDSLTSTLFSGEWWGSKWNQVKGWASDKWSGLTNVWNNALDGIKSTLFSGDWWTGHWESVKSFATSTFLNLSWWGEQAGYIWGTLETTLFSGEWWSSKWDSVKSWTSEKWGSFVDVWKEALTPLGETIFSGEWWSSQWGNVKSWTSEKWSSFVEVWESAKNLLTSTLFSGEWWAGKWNKVKGWTSQKWNEWSMIFENTKTKINETVFSSEWWSGKWDSVKGWTSSKWSEFSEVWNNARDKISSTLFSADWWSGNWGQVKSWASSAWADITSGFQIGRSNAISNNTYVTPTPYARGGIATRPHLGLVAEAGVPEAMIPWDGSSRSKALWQQTGEALGMFDNASAARNGGNSNTAVSSGASGNSSGLVLNVGDITIGQANNWTAEGILDMITPALYELIVASLAKR